MPVVDDVAIVLNEGPDDLFQVTLTETPVFGRVYLANEVPYANAELPGVDDVQGAIDALLGGIGLADNYVTLATAQNIPGVKTFTANPVFNDAAIPQAKVAGLPASLAALVAADAAHDAAIAARALDNAVVHLAGAETITGAKTFAAGVTVNLAALADGLTLTGAANVTPRLVLVRGGVGTRLLELSADTNTNASIKTTSSLLIDATTGVFTRGGQPFSLGGGNPAGSASHVTFTDTGDNANAGLTVQTRAASALRTALELGLAGTGGLSLYNPAAATVGLLVKAAASQTGDLQQWQDSAAAVLAFVKSTGFAGFGIAAQGAAGVGGQPGVEATNGVRAIRSAVPTQYLEILGNVNGPVLNAVGNGKALSIRNESTAAGPPPSSVAILFQQGSSGAGGGGVNGCGGIDYLNHWFIGTGIAATGTATLLTVANPITTDNLATMIVTPTTNTNKGLVVQGYTSQTANLQEWQSSAGTASVSMSPVGRLFGSSWQIDSANSRATFGNAANLVGETVGIQTLASRVGIFLKGAAGQTADLQDWADASNVVMASVTKDGEFFTAKGVGIGTAVPSSLSLLVTPRSSSFVAAVVRGAASQTGDLQQWQDSAGTALLKVLAGGNLVPQSALAINLGGAGGQRFNDVFAGGLDVSSNNGSAIGPFTRAIGTTLGVQALAGTWTPLAVRGHSPSATITNKALTANVATLTTGSAHGFTTGRRVTVSGVGAPFDGGFVITSTPTGTTFTYARVNADVASIAATGTATADGQTSLPFDVRNGAGESVFNVSSTGGVVAKGIAGVTLNPDLFGSVRSWTMFAGSPGNYDGFFKLYRDDRGAAASLLASSDGLGLTLGGTLLAVPSGTGSQAIVARGLVGQTANVHEWQNSAGAALAAITAAGLPRWSAAANVQTTVGAAGAASALPATPSKYLKVVDDAGTTLVIPAYAAA